VIRCLLPLSPSCFSSLFFRRKKKRAPFLSFFPPPSYFIPVRPSRGRLAAHPYEVAATAPRSLFTTFAPPPQFHSGVKVTAKVVLVGVFFAGSLSQDSDPSAILDVVWIRFLGVSVFSPGFFFFNSGLRSRSFLLRLFCVLFTLPINNAGIFSSSRCVTH